MPVYKLTLTQPDYPNWPEVYQGELTVRANDPADARLIACVTLSVKSNLPPWRQVAACPWTDSHYVICGELRGENYAPEGRREVLFPSGRDRDFPDSPNYDSGGTACLRAAAEAKQRDQAAGSPGKPGSA